MKSQRKARMHVEVRLIPNQDRFMIQRQYTDGGLILTDDNNGFGYSHEKALLMARGEQVTAYVGWALAKDGEFLPGGAKRYETAPFLMREDARACLDAYLAGHQHRVTATGTKTVKVKPELVVDSGANDVT